MSRIIVKMTDFWRLVFPSRSWSLATLCDTLITFSENHWLLRLIWRFSESVSEYESVFGICVWIIIYKYCLLNSVINTFTTLLRRILILSVFKAWNTLEDTMGRPATFLFYQTREKRVLYKMEFTHLWVWKKK